MPSRYRKSLMSHSSLTRRAGAARKRQSREYFTQRRSLRIKLFLLILLIVFILALIAYFLFFSRFFRIQNINVSKITDYGLISEQELKEMATPLINKKFLIFSQKNIFVFRTKALQQIMDNDSRIEIFNVEKDLPQTLNIKIAEAKPVALLISLGNNKNCYLNSQGQLIYAQNFTTLKEEKTPLLPVFYDQTDVNLTDPEYVKLFKSVLDLIKCDILSQNNIKAELVKISEKAGIFEVEITTNEQWRILINSEVNFDQQISNLELILKEKIEDRNNLEYIDLRFGDYQRIYFKLKEE